jgi:hypothetical protein
MIYLMGTTKLDDKEVELLDNQGLYPISRLMGENTSWYGGRVTKYGYLKSNPELMMFIEEREGDGMKIIDLGSEKPTALPRESLKHLLNCRKIKYRNNLTTEELAELVSTCIV